MPSDGVAVKHPKLSCATAGGAGGLGGSVGLVVVDDVGGFGGSLGLTVVDVGGFGGSFALTVVDVGGFGGSLGLTVVDVGGSVWTVVDVVGRGSLGLVVLVVTPGPSPVWPGSFTPANGLSALARTRWSTPW